MIRAGRRNPGALLLLALPLALGGCSPANSTTPPTAPPRAAAAAPCTAAVEPGADLAARVEDQPEGAVICLGPGRFELAHAVRPKASQTLRGSDKTVLAGDVPLERWEPEGTVWAARGYLPPDYEKSGQCEDTHSKPCQVAEDLFLDGKPVRRVMTKGAVDATTFYADYAANIVYLGQDPAGRAPTLARTRTAIASNAPGVVIENLTVRGFANLAQQGAIVVEGNDWTVQNSTITANHGVGVMIAQADNAHVTGNSITANGQMGLGQYRSQGGRIDNNRIRNNNTAEFWRADWEAGGIKVTRSSSAISNNDVSNNLGVGVWVDIAGDGVAIIDNEIGGNAACGIRYEISRNGRIAGNTVTGNGLGLKRGRGTGLLTGAGITVNTSSDVTIERNTLAGNLNGIGLQARPRGNGPWGEYVLDMVRVEGNLIDLGSPATATTGYVESGALTRPPDMRRIEIQSNRYILEDINASKFNVNGGTVDFKAWQGSGYDSTGEAVPG
ncbi:right-handed parallel beta-helix repeat-containing protein [Arthrobacter sp. C9C5]|uniref:right-handed parallel beta-helix repeat-containing protein n=1 Tax=Arthrobacter sp. C9C5 TaxID=2735267 RepID=UPI001584FD7C|nr:right-handed parallel beta-helix repeat-containing protein [Arthrobacter sp. C9C5]NUU31984.1 right-handed parallel beta-helix repeat-containing protein [Arthrobacter sp. C9C5]